MRFAEPVWLWVGLGACATLCLALLWSERRRALALARFVAARHASALTDTLSRPRRALKYALLLAGVLSMFVALARPQWGYHFEEQRREGIDLMFAVDTSKSMQAEDLKPSRLARAKLAVQDLLAKMPDDRVGLIAFAGDAFLQTPLTLDRVAFRQSLDALDSDLIPVPGTDLQSALRVAEQAFGSESEHQKILLLLSDGEDLAGSALSAARAAAAKGITIYTIGIGTPDGALIPVRNERGATQLLRGPDGELVRSKLDETTLREMARASAGSYRALGPSGQGLEALYRDVLAKLPKQMLKARVARVYHERFQWPLGLGLVLLIVEWLVHDHKKRRSRVREAVAVAGCALLGAVAVTPSSVHAQDTKPVQSYNQASTQYRAGKFGAAEQSYRAALATRDLTLQERAYYDLGNAQYRQGQALAAKVPQLTQDKYKSAIASYESALALNKDDADAKYNRDFVRRKLQELQQQQPNQQPAKQNEQKQADQQKQDGQAKQGEQQKPDDAQAKQGEQQKPDTGDATKPAGKAGQVSHAGDTERGEREGQPAVPGGLTRQEAARLLDSLEGELHQLPSGYGETKPSATRDEHGKDW
jgi:Ca-activated chloride channel homolog